MSVGSYKDHFSTLYRLDVVNIKGEPYENPVFELVPKSGAQLAKLEFHNASPALHSMLRRTVAHNYMPHPDYIAKSAVNPFLQGGSDLTEGWLLIEFWCEDNIAERYVRYLEAKWVGMCEAHFTIERLEFESKQRETGNSEGGFQ